MNNYLAG